jgi:hypothetical protein
MPMLQVERRGIAASFGVRRGYHDRKEAQRLAIPDPVGRDPALVER